MFDRIGRIADETPFVVEWFFRNGIQVWSTQEGEQRFDTHTDKLMNYVRFWQADGESEKTSIRTKTRLGQIVEEGHFKGGNAPYGYRLIEGERLNKKKHRLKELEIIEEEAAVVRLIFEKYVYEGYGDQRIATYLNNNGYRARTGKPWHHGSIRGILNNLTYTGILRCGESRSQLQPHLQIISQELYDQVQEIRKARANTNEQSFVPRNTRGQSLLVGNIYCAHCGSKLNVTTNTKKNAAGQEVVRMRYICYGKKFKQTQFDGQTGYKMDTIDDMVNKLVQDIFQRMKGVSREEIIEQRFRQILSEQKALLSSAKSELEKAEKELASLKMEVIKSIQGESSFPTALLSQMVQESEEKCQVLSQRLCDAESVYHQTGATIVNLEKQYDQVLSMAEMYQNATLEAKKMIVGHMVTRVDVARDYQIKITLRPE